MEKKSMISKGTRMVNMECLRCIAMMMVVVLHYLGKGNLLGNLGAPNMSAVGIVSWGLESLAIVAVNVYMLISGYFLCETSYKISRLVKLYIQVWSYSVGVGLLSVLLGWVDQATVDTHFFLQLIFPVSMGHYWFITAYVFLYLVLPFLGIAIKKMTKRQFQVSLFLVLFFFCILKSILPVRLETDAKGYDGFWYICVFMTAAYFRKYGIPVLNKKIKGFLLYICSAGLIFGGTMALHWIYITKGKMGLLLEWFIEYNHVFVLLAAIGIFAAFLRMDEKTKNAKSVNWICKISGYTLGVYLLHENLGVRFVWQKWLFADQISNVPELFLYLCLAVIVVFGIGIVIEAVRSLLMKRLHSVLMHVKPYEKVILYIEETDRNFAKD